MRFWLGISAVLLVVPAIEANQQSAKRQDPARRANELTLAGIRPGRDKIAKVFNMYGKAKTGRKGDTQFSWEVHCQPEVLFVTTDQSGVVKEIGLRTQARDRVEDRKEIGEWRAGKPGDEVVRRAGFAES